MDQDIHKASGAVLPLGASRDVRDADKRAKEVEGLEILAYLAAFDSALYQRLDGSPDLRARRFVQPRWTTDNAIESRRNNMLGGDVVDEKHHPRPQRRHGRQFCGQFPLCRRELIHLGVIHGLNERAAGWEMPVQGSRPHAGLLGDLVEAGIGAGLRKRLLRHFQNALAVATGIGPRLAPGSRTLFGHKVTFPQSLEPM